MKRFCVGVLLIIIYAIHLSGALAATQVYNQLPASSFQGQFFALSVTNIDESVRWYSENLGLTVIKKIDVPDGTVKIRILEGNNLTVELLQSNKSASPKKCLKDIEEYLIQGIFKVGFYVTDLDKRIERWKANKVKFDMDVVQDKEMKIRFVLIRDNSGNLLQAFERMAQ